MTRLAVFAYGSLVAAASAAQTLGRDPGPMLPARLGGRRRSWSIMRDNLNAEKTFVTGPDGELAPWILGLNLEPDPASPPSAGPNGGLIEVSEAELERLDRRELRYDRIEVTGDCGPTPFDAVYAYTAKPDHFAPQAPDGAVVIADYASAVRAGFAALGPQQLQIFEETTSRPPVPVVAATLVRDRIPSGNPRRW